MRHGFMLLSMTFVMLALANPALATKKKAQKAHAHGQAALAIATDGQNLQALFDGPAEVIYGFEHEAKSEADQAAVSAADNKLKQEALKIFALPADASCQVQSNKLKHAAKHGEAESSKGKHKDNKQGHHEEHGHQEDEGHADIVWEVSISCKKPLAGTTLKLGLIQAFPRIKNLSVSLVTAAKQSKHEVKDAIFSLDL